MLIRPAAVVALVWSLLFAAIHTYWSLGGRGGLGSSARDADDALSTRWFAIYNATIVVLSLGAAVIAFLSARAGASPKVKSWLRPLALITGAVLVARGSLGVVLLLIDRGGSDDMPLLLLLIEPWFIVGGLAFLAVARFLKQP